MSIVYKIRVGPILWPSVHSWAELTGFCSVLLSRDLSMITNAVNEVRTYKSNLESLCHACNWFSHYPAHRLYSMLVLNSGSICNVV